MTSQVATRIKPQVFLTYALADREFADEVTRELALSGLNCVSMNEFSADGEYTEAIRKAVRQSAAVVAILSGVSRRHDVPANVLFEIGAAIGARKPIYVVVDDPSIRLPFGAPDMHVLPITRIDEIARHLSID
jgi:nucleoside 2-deoxyribosyltransferase